LTPSFIPPDASPQMDVAVIIVSFHSLADIVRCLAALETSTWRRFRVVICENGGEEAHRKLRENPPQETENGQPVELLLAPGNLGYAGGINFAIDHTAPADAYWILNPDTQPEPAALEAMLARLDQGDCSAVGHDLVDSNGRLGSRGGRWLKWSARAISLDKGKRRQPIADLRALEARLNYITGASLLVSRSFIQRAGKMREDYFLYCEEVEWCLRAVRRGEKLGYARDAIVRHAQGTATGSGGALRTQSKLAVYLMERNRILLTRDLYPGLMPVTLPLSLLHIAIKYTKARAWRQGSYALSGWLAGLANERNKPAWLKNSIVQGHNGQT
jgi:N-acetylglucosaminyl-diphospho-decaprenol L-rhamnosyltransferase